jgi:hypothetical protein
VALLDDAGNRLQGLQQGVTFELNELHKFFCLDISSSS